MIILLDNYDSFTWNLYDYLAQTGKAVNVIRNDACTVEEIQQMHAEAIVISPGPKTPLHAGITMQVIASLHTTLPMLGICLGYQAIGMHFGARLVQASEPMHGKTSRITHNADPIFAGIDSPMQVMRYHSLNLSEIPDASIRILAHTSAGEPMAIKHRKFPLYGMLFHPESVLTTFGKQLLHNWVQLLPVKV